MKNMTLKNIAAACGGVYFGTKNAAEQEITEVVTDSRQTCPGCLFVAIKGERVDGHAFIPTVFASGALCVLVESAPQEPLGAYILVTSTLQAVKEIAEFYRQQLDVKVIGITGSVGKTSTKEMVASILSEKYTVLKTLGNFNNELGLPLTIFRLREEHQVAVLEMGVSDFGEMHRLSKIARPDLCLITNVGQCHLEFLKDRDGVLKAKSEIFDYMAEDGGIILNGDDDKLSTIKEVRGICPIFFGIESNREIYADDIRPGGLRGIWCRIHIKGQSFEVLVPIPGSHMVLNALAGTAAGLYLGLTLSEIKAGIQKLESLDGRFHIINKNDLTIIDDCYNANPVSMKASISALKEAEHRKVAILGDMFELGENEADFHAEVGRHAAACAVDLLVCVGQNSRHIADAARAAGGCGEVLYIPTLAELKSMLGQLIQRKDTILVKASHGMHFNQVVEALSENSLFKTL